MKHSPTATTFLVLCAAFIAGPVAAQDHGHDHGPDQGAHDHASDVPTVAVTRWTENLELYLEHPEMIAGRPGEFVVHVTILDGFRPIRDGTLVLEFIAPDGSRLVHTEETLLRDGIFALRITLEQPGVHACEIAYTGPEAAGRVRLPDVTVHMSAITAHTGRTEHADQITFLKEQQWLIPFATAFAAEREIKRSVWAVGQVQPAPTAHVEITAPLDGIIHVNGPDDVALPGARVQRGDVVARVGPSLQGGGWTASRLALDQARRNYERAQRLRERDAISIREFEEAENAYLARQAGHEQLAGRGDGGVLDLTTPIDGQVIDWQVVPGRRVEAGDLLMVVADPALVWLRVQVHEADLRDLGTPVGVWIDDGEGGWTVPSTDLRVLTTGSAVDPVTRTVPVLLEVANATGRLAINASMPVELHAASGGRATAVPRTAVLEDGGLDVVFVQTGGESFARRVVRVGPTYADWVSILDGLEPGERVVIDGGYHVKLAGSTAEIGHGHAH